MTEGGVGLAKAKTGDVVNHVFSDRGGQLQQSLKGAWADTAHAPTFE
jgi:hypothetical protein